MKRVVRKGGKAAAGRKAKKGKEKASGGNVVVARILVCPVCRKGRLEMYAGWVTGSYICKKCGYIGSLVIEEDVKLGRGPGEKDAAAGRKP
jgi:hypothetical protein